ncbi:GNAT family acetyltransferase [Enterovibrio coralii]|uniref:GNAT family acetyltransferase n=1 Tax=Enterovibrio coralii TaxID=294935 RepID=A0A135IDC0_9GAMM|nr:GNAT family acetyltransferase [Enterovibrio coralii]
MDIKEIFWQETIDIRHQVLWPAEPPEFSSVEGDEDATHYGAFVGEKLVCVASVFTDGKQSRLRKFATLPDYQNRGIGKAMLNVIIESLNASDVVVFWCDARESAMGIYEGFGMKPEGERFYKADIPYFKMVLPLNER